MSTGVDQRSKGQSSQVANPNKDPVKDNFDSYLQPHQPGVYNSAPMSSPNVSDHYMPSYYPSLSFPYVNQGLGDGAWSTGGDPISFLGGYGQMSSDYMSSSGMFSGFTYGQPNFGGWDFASSDYSSWGTSNQPQQGRKTDSRAYGEDYYHPDAMGPMDAVYTTMNGDLGDGGMKGIDHGLKGVNISDSKVSESLSTKENIKPMAGDGSNSTNSSGSSGSQAPKKMSWASIASQPAKPQPKLQPKSIPRAPVLPSKHNMDIGTWDTKNNVSNKQAPQQPRQAWSASTRGRSSAVQSYSSGSSQNSGSASANSTSNGPGQAKDGGRSSPTATSSPILEKLISANQYNPKDFSMPKAGRCFIIKSYSEDDIHRSIKYSIWCSTEHGNKRLDAAQREQEGKGPIYLFFSVNGSGHFCGMAQMMSPLDYSKSSGVWAQDKWKGQFEVKWIYVKDVPNSQLRHIRLENNENKPVTNSRDTQEVPYEKAKQVWKIMHNYRHTTSIFDDFIHYEKRQQEDERRTDDPPPSSGHRTPSGR